LYWRKPGLRPGELVRLLIEDVDLQCGWLSVRGKPELGWITKTNRERRLPLSSEAVAVMRHLIGSRSAGTVFLRHKFTGDRPPPLSGNRAQPAEVASQRLKQVRAELGQALAQTEEARIYLSIWKDSGAVPVDHVRTSFIRTAKKAGLSTTCPKSWRHTFATLLQEANVDLLVRQETLGHKPSSPDSLGTDGGLDRFTTELARSALRAPGATTRPYEITLIGHSMGSMVVNELLRRQTAHEIERGQILRQTPLPVTNIVYMAAACSIRDFNQSVIPFMQREEHKKVQFYDLCLHPTAELIESNYGDLPPRGSLLCWIDDFLAEPSTPLDRTLGRWENLIQVPYIIPQPLRGRVSIKAFALNRKRTNWLAGANSQPQHHGDFSVAPYWNPKFWEPAPPIDPQEPRLKAVENSQRQMVQKRALRGPSE
jgi:pimeloyl-ACP methyl ester carboxylesterase